MGIMSRGGICLPVTPGISTWKNVVVEFFLPFSCYNATEFHFNGHYPCKARVATSIYIKFKIDEITFYKVEIFI